MEQYLIILIALLTHHGCTNLTEAYAMPPALAVQAEALYRLLDIEGRAVEMALAEGTTDFEFLTDGEGLLRTHNLQLPDASALAAL